MKQTEILTHAIHVNGWSPAVYMSCMSQNFRLFHVSNLSVRNFRMFPLMYTGSVAARVTVRPPRHSAAGARGDGKEASRRLLFGPPRAMYGLHDGGRSRLRRHCRRVTGQWAPRLPVGLQIIGRSVCLSVCLSACLEAGRLDSGQCATPPALHCGTSHELSWKNRELDRGDRKAGRVERAGRSRDCDGPSWRSCTGRNLGYF